MYVGTGASQQTYTVNTTKGGANLYLWNLTKCISSSLGMDWGIGLNTVYVWKNGLMWSNPMNATLNGITQSVTLGAYGFSCWGQNTIVITTGTVSVAEQKGFQLEAGFSTATGQMRMDS